MKEQLKPRHTAAQSMPPAREIVLTAIDAADLGSATLRDLGALFAAIARTCDEHHPANRLAGIGSYLADDWSAALDAEKEKFESWIEVKS